MREGRVSGQATGFPDFKSTVRIDIIAVARTFHHSGADERDGFGIVELKSTGLAALGKQAGISLNPSTPAKMLDYLIDDIDLVLVMSVNPGFGGQSFISSQLRKIEAIRRMIDKSGRPILIEVDGGVDHANAAACVAAGADVLVAGTATFRGGPDRYAANIAALKASG